MPKRLTTEQFILRSQEVHNGIYDYSKVIYTKNCCKVSIICPKHGEFQQVASEHLRGHGCPICGVEKAGKSNSIGQNTFIKRAKKAHNNKYDYSKVIYKTTKDKVCVICPIHGEFWQMAENHFSGQGCPKCGQKERSDKQKLTTSEFIAKANNVHGTKFDYSKTNYISAKEKVCIICPEHDEFWQIANDHLNGCGCPICGSVYSRAENEIYERDLNPSEVISYNGRSGQALVARKPL